MKKALVLWSLLLVLALLAGCGSQAADNGNDTPNNDAVTDSQDNVPADNAPVDDPANTPADSAPVDYPALFERARISDGDLRRIAARIKDFALSITGVCGFDQAQVTAGGLRCEEFDPRTMESRLVPGFYACGEVLDIDGDCGGYNLQWAWSSGRVAGQVKTL